MYVARLTASAYLLNEKNLVSGIQYDGMPVHLYGMPVHL